VLRTEYREKSLIGARDTDMGTETDLQTWRKSILVLVRVYIYIYVHVSYPYPYPESYEHVVCIVVVCGVRSTEYCLELLPVEYRHVVHSDRIQKMYLVLGPRLRLCILLNPTEYK
jgi:hypothetical protein